MIKTFRVAAFAAATAFLCNGNAVAAQEVPTSPSAPVAVAAPAPTDANVSATPGPQPAVVTTFGPIASEGSTADTVLTPGRVRPDRALDAGAAPIQPAQPATPTASTPVRRSLADLVAEHAGTETSGEQFECLARAVYFESRGEPLEGQLAVAEVILNRVRSGRFRATVCDVVKQPSQFSFVRRGVIPQPPRTSAPWQRAVAIAHIAMQDLHDVTGEESLFFHATYVNPGWGRPRIARIGNHIFYR